MGKLAAYLLAILNDDAGFRLIDIDTQQSGRGTLKLNQLVAHAVKGGFDQICQMHCIPEIVAFNTMADTGQRLPF
ncbi:hypothetical protein D3C87_1158030 [compost metagenome]